MVWKLVLVLILLWGLAALCFRQAFRIHYRSAVDPTTRHRSYYNTMTLWICAGTSLAIMGFVVFNEFVNPFPKSAGKP